MSSFSVYVVTSTCTCTMHVHVDLVLFKVTTKTEQIPGFPKTLVRKSEYFSWLFEIRV